MVIDMKKAFKTFSVVVLPWLTLAIFLIATGQLLRITVKPYVIGAFIHIQKEYISASPVSSVRKYIAKQESERFQRPSKQAALPLKYSFQPAKSTPPYIPEGYPKIYGSPEDVIQAYFSILKEASNMLGFSGGCGTIGWAQIPYPYAYGLLSEKTKKEIPLEAFIKSFSGFGHITLLKLLPAYQPPDTPENIRSYMVEIEILTGKPEKDTTSSKDNPSYFAYYYGIIRTEHSPSEGWKIKSLDYTPEDFLCAPYHHWHWDSKSFVSIVYKGWYKLIDTIDGVHKNGPMISVYASSKEQQYRFDFVRLTNGEDVLLHEYIRSNKKWKEVQILKPEHQSYKLTVNAF